jgi:hypothetical protein
LLKIGDKPEEIPKRDILKELLDLDLLIRPIQGFLKSGKWFHDPITHKITWYEKLEWESANWIHAKSDIRRSCAFLQAIAGCHGFIHSWCLNCWKVVVRPRNLFEAYQLMVIQHELLENNPVNPEDYYAKTGPEIRDYVFGHWGGYFYNRSKSDGLARYRQVRELVNKRISPEIPVILKRYCTEYELTYGPSWKYEQPKGAKEKEELLDAYVTPPSQIQDPIPPYYLKLYHFSKWVERAYANGDPTALFFTGGKPLAKPVHTYHQELKVTDKILIIAEGK